MKPRGDVTGMVELARGEHGIKNCDAVDAFRELAKKLAKRRDSRGAHRDLARRHLVRMGDPTDLTIRVLAEFGETPCGRRLRLAFGTLGSISAIKPINVPDDGRYPCSDAIRALLSSIHVRPGKSHRRDMLGS